jgi:hypothetical protein
VSSFDGETESLEFGELWEVLEIFWKMKGGECLANDSV